MIHSLYDHGGDHPAAGLTHAQIRGALHDAAGALWIDLASSTAEEVRSVLGGIFEFENRTIAECIGGEGRPAIEEHGHYIQLTVLAPGADASSPLVPVVLVLGRNFVVSQRRAAVPAIDTLRSQLADRPAALQAGSGVVGAALADAVVTAHDQTLRAHSRADSARAAVAVRHALEPLAVQLRHLATGTLPALQARHQLSFGPVAERATNVADKARRDEELAGAALRDQAASDLGRTAAATARIAAFASMGFPALVIAVLVADRPAPVAAMAVTLAAMAGAAAHWLAARRDEGAGGT